jgi:type VI secretion system secreted protein Hcp
MALYLKITDGRKQIKGDVTNPSYLHWIELDSITLGVDRTISSDTAGEARGERPNFQDIVVTKYQDSASALLELAFRRGDSGPASIAFLEIMGKGYWRETLRLELEGVLIVGYALSSTGDRPLESYSLNFTGRKFIQQ